MAEFSSPIIGGLRVARNRFASDSIFRRPDATEDNENAQILQTLNNNQISLQNVNASLSAVNAKISELNSSFIRISDLMRESSQLEKLKENQLIQQENILAQQQLRAGKEGIVEKRIESALVFPVKKIGAKVQFTLSNLMNVFTILLTGWLTNQVLTNFEFYSNKVKSGLNLIKNGVTSGFDLIKNIFNYVKNGFEKITETVGRISSVLKRALLTDIFKKPFDFLVSKLQEYWNSVAIAVNESGFIKFINEQSSKIPFIDRNIIEFPTFNIENSSSANEQVNNNQSTQQNNTLTQNNSSGTQNNLSNIFKNSNSNISQSFSEGMNFDKLFNIDAQSTLNFPKVNDLMSSSAKMNENEDIPPQPTIPDIRASYSGEINLQDSIKSSFSATGVAQVSSPPKNERIARASQQELEQKTQVILTPLPTQQVQQKVPAVGGYGNDLPAILSSNPDNFYTLYSQINYNVV